MLMEASATLPRAARLSVKGAKTMFAGLEVPAFCDRQTPPPVVPTYSRLPVGSEGSSASAETRPVTRPNSTDWTAAGPSDCQAALPDC